MNEKQRHRCEIITRLIANKISSSEASELLGRSSRQVRRIRQRYEAQGLQILVHGNQGRPSPRRRQPALLEQLRELAGPTGRYHDFNVELERHQKLFRVFLIGGAIIGIPLNLIIALRYLDSSVAGSFVLPFSRRLIAQSGYLALTLAYASALALLFQRSRWRRYLLMFVPVGRMALTCYLFQTLLGLWLFYGFMPGPDLMGTIGPTWLVLVWVIGYLAQVWLASVWLRHFRFGPAEWLWRSLHIGNLNRLELVPQRRTEHLHYKMRPRHRGLC